MITHDVQLMTTATQRQPPNSIAQAPACTKLGVAHRIEKETRIESVIARAEGRKLAIDCLVGGKRS